MIIWIPADVVPAALGIAFIVMSPLFAFLAPWSAPRKRLRAGRRSARLTH